VDEPSETVEALHTDLERRHRGRVQLNEAWKVFWTSPSTRVAWEQQVVANWTNSSSPQASGSDEVVASSTICSHTSK
jgi:hypothetical protein